MARKRTFIRRKTRLRVWVRDLAHCRYCGRFGFWWQMEIDHIHPWSLGGVHWGNLALACPECNGRKSNHIGWKPRPLAWWQVAFDWLLILVWDCPQPEDFE